MTDPALFPPGEPPISGEVQFWRMDPASWEESFTAVRGLGIGTIATYLSWRRHEPRPGDRDLRGRHGPELDVHRFLTLCRQIGLRVILKPGPWICAEETNGGLPDWLVVQDDVIALDHEGAPVLGYNPPFRHPMPSYASTRFRAEVEKWIRFVWTDLSDFVGDDGPVVATQYDNEPSLGFQDSMYGFDHHPEALASWHAFLGDATAPPRPRRTGGRAPTPLERRWIRWQQHYIAGYLAWLRDVTSEAGAPGLAATINLNTHPVRGVPQSGRDIALALPGAVVGEDHYFVPPLDSRDLAGLAVAAAQAQLTATPLVWAPEMQAGIWRSPGEYVDYPDPTVEELSGWWAAALAFGYQGFNLYMLVNRENWEHAPLPGSDAPLAEAVRSLLATMRAVPDLAEFRPLADLALPWSNEILERAYRVRGTQAAPLAPWDDPAARAAYDAVEARALHAVERGLQVSLDPTGAAASTGSPFPEPRLQAPEGVLARLHEHPDGRQLLYVVRWARHTALYDVQLRLGRGVTAVAEALTGDRHDVGASGIVQLSYLRSGLNLFHVVTGGE